MNVDLSRQIQVLIRIACDAILMSTSNTILFRNTSVDTF